MINEKPAWKQQPFVYQIGQGFRLPTAGHAQSESSVYVHY